MALIYRVQDVVVTAYLEYLTHGPDLEVFRCSNAHHVGRNSMIEDMMIIDRPISDNQ